MHRAVAGAASSRSPNRSSGASWGRRSATASPPWPACPAIRRSTTPALRRAACGSPPTAAQRSRRCSTASRVAGDRRARGRADRAEYGLGRHRRSVGDPSERRHRRRHLQVHRRRRHLDAHGARRNRPHRPHHRPPDRSEHRLCLRPRAHHRAAAGARRLQDDGWRTDAGTACCSSTPNTGCSGLSMDAKNPERAGGRHVAGGDASLGDAERRRRQRHLS